MKQKIFLDTNVVLDVIEMRAGWKDAALILDRSAKGKLKAYVSVISLATIAYILEDKYHPDVIKTKLLHLLQSVECLPTSSKAVSQALLSDLPDIEDEMQYFTAQENDCTVITRDEEFIQAHPGIITPEQFIRK